MYDFFLGICNYTRSDLPFFHCLCPAFSVSLLYVLTLSHSISLVDRKPSQRQDITFPGYIASPSFSPNERSSSHREEVVSPWYSKLPWNKRYPLYRRYSISLMENSVRVRNTFNHIHTSQTLNIIIILLLSSTTYNCLWEGFYVMRLFPVSIITQKLTILNCHFPSLKNQETSELFVER